MPDALTPANELFYATEDELLIAAAEACAGCGCTDAAPCPGGCAWVSHRRDLCSRCGLALMLRLQPEVTRG